MYLAQKITSKDASVPVSSPKEATAEYEQEFKDIFEELRKCVDLREKYMNLSCQVACMWSF